MKPLQWTPLDSAAAEDIRRVFSDRVNSITSYPSPFQIPDAFRTWQDDNGDLFVGFRYLDEGEPTHSIAATNGVIATVGKNSGRIFGLKISRSVLRDSINRGAGNRAAMEAITDLGGGMALNARRSNYRDNYKITRHLFDEGLVRVD